jgi:hypothetical protein
MVAGEADCQILPHRQDGAEPESLTMAASYRAQSARVA